MNRGVLYAASAYAIWGVVPVFWKQLDKVPSQETLGHRVVWSFLLLLVVAALRRNWKWLPRGADRRVVIRTSLATAFLLGVNWFTYIWAINAGFIIESSLGYFINPLVNVLLAVLFLKESLRAGQWAAILVAATGVAWLTLTYGRLPWIALTLALSFGFYGLLRKRAPIGALNGLTLEMGVIAIPAIGFLLYLEFSGASTFGRTGPVTAATMIFSGVVTTVPLLLFGAGAKRVRLVTLGVLQYIAPTMQLLIGVFVYHEPFPFGRLLGFALIWSALALYTVEGVMIARRQAKLHLGTRLST